MRNLAADSRGISGVALAIWRKALRNQPEGDDSKQQSKNNKESAQSWAVPLDKLKLPVMPVSPEYNLGIVLHALLLHDGLSKTDLALVTAVQEPELSLVLLRLKQAEIIAAALPVDKEVRRIASLNTMDAAAKGYCRRLENMACNAIGLFHNAAAFAKLGVSGRRFLSDLSNTSINIG